MPSPPETDWHILIVPLLSAVASFIGAWLAAFFALGRFYKERSWDRRANAYSTIFAALHDIEQWYDKHLDALVEARQLSTEKTEQLRIEANKGEMELERKLSEEAWIIPDEFRLRVEALTANLANYRGQEWTEYLEHGYSSIRDAKNDLRNMARKHLKTKMY